MLLLIKSRKGKSRIQHAESVRQELIMKALPMLSPLKGGFYKSKHVLSKSEPHLRLDTQYT
jgi:hypothetical protein